MLAVMLAGLFGLLLGSFLNVCIYRWPRDLSVVKPRSSCPECGHMIAWYDNVPLLSFALLRGRCRGCRAAISRRYPAVELLTGICFAWFVARYGLSAEAAKYCVFSGLLIGLIFSDWETLILPDQFTLGGLAIGLAFAPFTNVPGQIFALLCDLAGVHLSMPAARFGEAAFGAGFPAGALWLLGVVFEKVRHKEGLGFGDVKMIAMVGAFLGLQGALLTVIVGSIAGSILGYGYIRLTKQDAATFPLPFASFLGAAALLAAVRVSLTAASPGTVSFLP
jgi:leader peptidase (prepilin peptidase)/N-methyltransferase